MHWADSRAVARERERREAMWLRLAAIGGPDRVTVQQIQEAGLRPANTGQGVFRDLTRTSEIGPAGVTLTLLDLGTSYEDEFDDEGGTYHYPSGGGRRGRDDAEVEATKTAYRLGLPVFVVLRGPEPRLRDVRRGWVTDFDDRRGVFLISFDSAILQEPRLLVPPATTVRERVMTLRLARPGQRAFAFRVFKRYGASCALCDHAVRSILEAAHVIPVKDGGTDSSDNGLALCRNHHRAFDIDLVAFEPETVRVDLLRDGPQAAELQLAHLSLEHLTSRPDERALRWRWGTSREVAGVPKHPQPLW